MKIENFTLKRLFVITFVLLTTVIGSYAQNDATGTGWGNIGLSEGIILNEDFSGFEFFGNWAHTNDSNSKPYVDENSGETVRGTQEGDSTVYFLNVELSPVYYSWDSCAFAPEWGVAYSIDDETGIPVDPDPTTSGVSNGFVEIAREGYGTHPGHFIIDLRKAEYVEGIEYSHSSCGGSKRGFMLSLSNDDGATWDTLRYQSGNYQDSFTKDPFTWEKTPNDFTCMPSANGMLWEDGLYLDNVMLKFESAGGQAVRIHDVKVYGTAVGVKEQAAGLKVNILKDVITASEKVDFRIYSITGKVIKAVNNVTSIQLNDMNNGAYIVKAQKNNEVIAKKFIKQ